MSERLGKTQARNLKSITRGIFNLIQRPELTPEEKAARDQEILDREWNDPLAVEIGPYGGAEDIPCEIWGDDFDAKSAARLADAIGEEQDRIAYENGVPGIKPPKKD